MSFRLRKLYIIALIILFSVALILRLYKTNNSIFNTTKNNDETETDEVSTYGLEYFRKRFVYFIVGALFGLCCACVYVCMTTYISTSEKMANQKIAATQTLSAGYETNVITNTITEEPCKEDNIYYYMHNIKYYENNRRNKRKDENRDESKDEQLPPTSLEVPNRWHEFRKKYVSDDDWEIIEV